MKITLSDLGSIAAIVMVPVVLFSWLFTRERFVGFWRKRFNVILAIALLIALGLSWWQGWFDWLENRVSLPAWILVSALLLYTILWVCLAIEIHRFALDNTLDKFEELLPSLPNYYERHGAQWPVSAGLVDRPPECSKCLMEMLCVARAFRFPGGPLEVWRCRECGHKIEWNARENGDLLTDLNARYRAELRHAEAKGKTAG